MITVNGYLKMLNGGYETLTKNRKSRERLYDMAQYAVIIAAVYYSFEIIKQIFSFFRFISDHVCLCVH